MLREWFTYWRTPCAPAFKHRGLLQASIALQARYRRCKEAWFPHLSACHAAILRAAITLDTPKTIVILGAGPCYDVPLLALLLLFENVILIDVVHPAHIQKLAKRHANLHLRTQDITGLCHGYPRPGFHAHDAITADLVVSQMVLSQLALPYADTKTAYQIQKSHLDGLMGGRGAFLIITDTESHHVNPKTGHINTTTPLLHPKIQHQLDSLQATAPQNYGEWIWALAPQGEASPHTHLHHTVSAIFKAPNDDLPNMVLLP
jgi:hypothetical protein